MNGTTHVNGVHNVNGIGDHGGNSTTDVLIVGAGVVGCLTAIKLAQAGIRVHIIEKLSEPSEAPRACGYFGATQIFLNELGLYNLIRAEGFMTRAIGWRGLPNDHGGHKAFGDLVAMQPLCAPGDQELAVGAGILNLTQGKLNRLLVREARKTGLVTIDFGTGFESISQNDRCGVEILAQHGGELKAYRARFCVAADGAHSVVRKDLGFSFPGHQWPERLLATNVRIPNTEDPVAHTYYYMSEKHWGVATPLEEPTLGQRTLWRYAIAIPPEEGCSDDELLGDEHILALYETRLPGPRPLQAQIEARVLYKIHQRLAPSMRAGNCVLAGDAAHVCNVSLERFSVL